MTRPLQQLIDALRQELQHHGELLARLDEIPAVCADPENSGAARAVESQAETLLATQRERERLQLQLAWAAEQPGACSFEELIPVLPSAYRPLLTALVQEIESLRRRVGDRLRESLAWLDRACEVSDRILGVIAFPQQAGLSLSLVTSTAPSTSVAADPSSAAHFHPLARTRTADYGDPVLLLFTA